VHAIAEVIQFLVVNELPLRGDAEHFDGEGAGLFQNLFLYTLKKDARLHTIAQTVPLNAKYTSPDIQNEIIAGLADAVVSEIVKDMQSSPTFSILADETKDRQGIEDLAVGIRYLAAGKVKPSERCIGILPLTEQNAPAILKAILSVLNDTGVGTDRLIAQTYDGASVMSGSTGGVQTLLCEKLERHVPYVHCFSHQLHLIVVGMLAGQNDIRRFLDTCEQMYIFFRRTPVAKFYDGKTLKRLMEHRWSGHLAAIDVISCSKTAICEALENIRDNGPADLAAMATGFLVQIQTDKFSFITVFLNRLLHLIEPVNKQLQADALDIPAATRMINAVRAEVQIMRSDVVFKQVVAESGIQLTDDSSTTADDATEIGNSNVAKRKRRPPARLTDYLSDQPGYRYAASSNVTLSTLRELYFAVLDKSLAEFDRRFTKRSMTLISAINSLLSDSKTVDDLLPLIELVSNLPAAIAFSRDDQSEACQINKMSMINRLRAELPLANQLLGNEQSLNELFQKLQPHAHSLEMFSLLCRSALPLPCSSAKIEACFSTLTRLLRPQRVSMTHERKAQLVLLAFNKDVLQNINLNKFVIQFATSKHRRLLLL
jgi:hypothetical protein